MSVVFDLEGRFAPMVAPHPDLTGVETRGSTQAEVAAAG
ncbi:hypothetical protein JOH50_001984 [Rhizobium leguminosarum]|nr:hypothetical protein [Rhizobium leguminosarum]